MKGGRMSIVQGVVQLIRLPLLAVAASLVCSTAAFAENWCAPVNLGPVINASFQEGYPQVAPNALALYFESNRPGGFGGFDLYVSHRATPNDPWRAPVNLGPLI